MGGVEDDTGDVDEAGVVEPVQHGFVEAAQAPALDQIRNRRWAVDFEKGWATPRAPGRGK
ncbi:hypothetical protein GCM10023083_20700 [Streptomyces phyllanthi]